MSTTERKSEHVRICLEERVEPQGAGNGLDAYRFDHDPLPNLDFDAVDASTEVLGRRLRWPFYVGSMTGGTLEAGDLNSILAAAAARSGCGMALGSLRAAVEDPARLPTFDVRKSAPDLPLLLGNVGVAQLAEDGFAERLFRVCGDLGLDALIVHLNPMQELMQPEGDTRFSGLFETLAEFRTRLRDASGLPLVLKEVGSGFSGSAAVRLKALAPDLVETSGTGGTSWIGVEGFRTDDPVRGRCSKTLAAWGHSLAESLINLRAALPDVGVVASGGLRTGLDLAVAVRLGAVAGAMALPLLRAASEGPGAVDLMLDTLLFEFRAVMFGTGSRTIEELRLTRMTGPGGRMPPCGGESDRDLPGQ